MNMVEYSRRLGKTIGEITYGHRSSKWWNWVSQNPRLRHGELESHARGFCFRSLRDRRGQSHGN